MNAGFGDWLWAHQGHSFEVSRHLDQRWSDYERKLVQRVSRMRLSDIPPSNKFFDDGIRKNYEHTQSCSLSIRDQPV